MPGTKSSNESKYQPLWAWIQENGTEKFTLTYNDIEKIIGIPIDHSFLSYKKELEKYGYRVEKISIKLQTVAFCKL